MYHLNASGKKYPKIWWRAKTKPQDVGKLSEL
jgi:hypothetical protein